MSYRVVSLATRRNAIQQAQRTQEQAQKLQQQANSILSKATVYGIRRRSTAITLQRTRDHLLRQSDKYLQQRDKFIELSRLPTRQELIDRLTSQRQGEIKVAQKLYQKNIPGFRIKGRIGQMVDQAQRKEGITYEALVQMARKDTKTQEQQLPQVKVTPSKSYVNIPAGKYDNLTLNSTKFNQSVGNNTNIFNNSRYTNYNFPKPFQQKVKSPLFGY